MRILALLALVLLSACATGPNAAEENARRCNAARIASSVAQSALVVYMATKDAKPETVALLQEALNQARLNVEAICGAPSPVLPPVVPMPIAPAK